MMFMGVVHVHVKKKGEYGKVEGSIIPKIYVPMSDA
jgi:hypothetical protein